MDNQSEETKFQYDNVIPTFKKKFVLITTNKQARIKASINVPAKVPRTSKNGSYNKFSFLATSHEKDTKQKRLRASLLLVCMRVEWSRVATKKGRAFQRVRK